MNARLDTANGPIALWPRVFTG